MKKGLFRKVFVSTSFALIFMAAADQSIATPTLIEPSAKCAMLTFERAYENARAVFVGEVIDIERKGDVRVFEFRVKRYWKGVTGKTVKVAAYENQRYQAPFEEGESFLVFATANEDGGLWDGRCSRTRNMESYAPSKNDDLKRLGKAKTCIDLGVESTEKKPLRKYNKKGKAS